jgi:hypothetical protein
MKVGKKTLNCPYTCTNILVIYRRFLTYTGSTNKTESKVDFEKRMEKKKGHHSVQVAKHLITEEKDEISVTVLSFWAASGTQNLSNGLVF